MPANHSGEPSNPPAIAAPDEASPSDTTPIADEVLKQIAAANARLAAADFSETEPPETGPYADPRD